MLHLNSSTGQFAYFYIDDGLNYPQLDAPKNKTSYLHKIQIIDYGRRNCTDYTTVTQSVYETCGSRDDCIQQCVLKEFFDLRYGISSFVNFKLENITAEFLSFKFNKNFTLFQSVRKKCEHEKHRDKECYSLQTILRTKSILTDPHDLSVTLTPKLIHTHRALNESTLLVINRIISFLIMLTGISVKDAVRGFIANYFYSLASLCNYTFLNRSAYLLVFLFFSMHFTCLFCSIVYNPMSEKSYRTVLDEIVLPKIRICYEISTDLSEDKHNKHTLDRESLNATEIFEKIELLDRNLRKHKVSMYEKWSNDSLFSLYDFYVDMWKCFNIDFKINYPVLSTNSLESHKLVTLVLNIAKVPRRRIFVHLNSRNSLDFEWYMPFKPGYYNVMYIAEDLMFQDDFWLLKNLFVYIKSVFGLENLKNLPHLYYLYLRDSFFKEQYVTTTVIPLGNDGVQDATIRNHQVSRTKTIKLFTFVKLKPI